MQKSSRVVGLALVLALPLATTHAAPSVETRADRDAVAELIYCYARGTDGRRQLSWPLGDNYLGRRDGDGSDYFFALPLALPFAAALRR
jgi:hypothetical protein